MFVQLEVPENVPLCVASDPSQRFVRAVPAFEISERLLVFSNLSVLRFAKFVSITAFDVFIAFGSVVMVLIF